MESAESAVHGRQKWQFPSQYAGFALICDETGLKKKGIMTVTHFLLE
jgi:hypothetical protein